MKRENYGLTILEALIGIAIFVSVAAIVIGGLSKFLIHSKLSQETENTVSFIREARQRTLAAEQQAAYGVHLEANQMVQFVGPTYSPGTSTNIIRTVDDEFILTNISLNGGGADVLFERITGATTANGTFEIQRKNDTSLSQIISIYEPGTISF